MLEAQLDSLTEAGLVRLLRGQPDLEYIFRHSLVQDAAYSSLLRADRRVLHAAVAAALEGLYAERPAGLAAILGGHFREAGDQPRARHYFGQAGTQALAAFANHEAAAHYHAALALEPPAPEQSTLLAGLGEALGRLGQTSEALASWRQAVDLYRESGDLDTLYNLYARMARLVWHGANSNETLGICLEGLEIVGTGVETPGLAALMHETARAYRFMGDLEAAGPLCRQALEMAGRVGDVTTQAEALITASLLLPVGACRERVAYLQQALAVAEAANLPLIAIRAYFNMGATLSACGDLPGSRDGYAQSAVLAGRMGIPSREVYGLANAVNMQLFLGEFVEAERNIARGQALLQTLAEPGKGAINLDLCAVSLLRYRGRLQEAIFHTRRLLNTATESGDWQVVGSGSFFLGEVLLELGELAEAEALFLTSLELSNRRLGEDPARPQCLLAVVYARQGRLADAARLLAEGEALAATPATKLTVVYGQVGLARATGKLDAALAALAQTARACGYIGLRWYQARALQEQAEVYLQRGAPGDRALARQALSAARALFTTMGADLYIEQVAAQLAEVQDEDHD